MNGRVWTAALLALASLAASAFINPLVGEDFRGWRPLLVMGAATAAGIVAALMAVGSMRRTSPGQPVVVPVLILIVGLVAAAIASIFFMLAIRAK